MVSLGSECTWRVAVTDLASRTLLGGCALVGAAVVGGVVRHDCDVYGDCLLLRGPGRDVTDPSGRHRRGWVRGQKWGGVDLDPPAAEPNRRREHG